VSSAEAETDGEHRARVLLAQQCGGRGDIGVDVAGLQQRQVLHRAEGVIARRCNGAGSGPSSPCRCRRAVPGQECHRQGGGREHQQPGRAEGQVVAAGDLHRSLVTLVAWADRHRPAIAQARHAYDRAAGAEAQPV